MRRTAVLVLGFAGGLAANACVLPNPDHCQNLALDSNVWCAEHYDDRPYCSPCTAEQHGCVATEPSEDECPEYTPPPDTETDSGTGEDSGGATETG